MKSNRFLAIALIVAALLGVSVSASATPHRIGVRQVSGVGEFYDTVTNLKFVPRGNNYVRLVSGAAHSTFDPGLYDATQAANALAQMHYDGYNVVRVFLAEHAIGNPSGGLSSVYLANVTDFLNKAKAQGIYTQLTLTQLPADGGYYVTNQNPTQIQDVNWYYLSAEGVDAKKRYIRDLINGLLANSAPLDYVFSYNIENEQFYLEDKAPLSMTSGLVSTPTGTYDMSNAAQRQQMMDSNLVTWINQVRAAALAVDPTALVAPGFFAPRVVTGSDPRIDRTYWAIADPSTGGSSADFVDLHSYPTGQAFFLDYNSFEISSTKKPLILGEFGAFKSNYPSISTAAYAMRDWQKISCSYGFAGWGFWTFDTTEQPSLWNLMDSAGAIDGQLAPIARPDPCL